nr:MAG: hypothetical protein [Lokiarchaeota virus Skoll Meg22_1214]
MYSDRDLFYSFIHRNGLEEELEKLNDIKRKCFCCKTRLTFKELFRTSLTKHEKIEYVYFISKTTKDLSKKLDKIERLKRELFHELSKLWMNDSIQFLCCDCFNVYEMFFSSIK